MLSAGQRVPGDCLVIESSDLTVDENVDDKFKLKRDEKGDVVKGTVQLDHMSKAPYTHE
jgi:hypothetical protein